MIRIGTAGWGIHASYAHLFPSAGTHLERYAAVMNAVEINSSFYRPHQRSTYERWAASTPASFRFAVKVPKAATHESRLKDTAAILDRFLDEVAGLGAKLGPLLIQLPPSLPFDASVAAAFFSDLRARHAGHLACEPRHASWFTSAADALLAEHRVVRVAADPPAGAPAAAKPGGWPGLVYRRLHGAPRIYYSNYDSAVLEAIAGDLAARADQAEAWCIFDNTAAFAALDNALSLMAKLATHDDHLVQHDLG